MIFTRMPKPELRPRVRQRWFAWRPVIVDGPAGGWHFVWLSTIVRYYSYFDGYKYIPGAPANIKVWHYELPCHPGTR